jgi:hypothetical protein
MAPQRRGNVSSRLIQPRKASHTPTNAPQRTEVLKQQFTNQAGRTATSLPTTSVHYIAQPSKPGRKHTALGVRSEADDQFYNVEDVGAFGMDGQPEDILNIPKTSKATQKRRVKTYKVRADIHNVMNLSPHAFTDKHD